MIDQRTLEALHASTRIEEVIGSFISLQKKGTKFWGCCPFHKEKTPSFVISPDRGIYKCFGCGVSGDTIAFLQGVEGMSFVDAVKFLAARYGIEVEEVSMEKREEQTSYEAVYVLLERARDFFIKNLLESSEGRERGLRYLVERDLSEEIIQKFGLGYSLSAWDGLYKELTNLGYTREVLLQAGLVIEKDHRTYDRFRGRVIFPIHNAHGKVVAFGARIIENSSDQPKYINSPETDFFQKRNILYGLHQAKQEMRKQDCCYLVEGYTDVLALHGAGIKNAVCSMGTALTLEQIEVLKRSSENVIVLFDGDSAGIKAALRSIDLLLEQGLFVKVILLPEGEDPHSLVSKMSGVVVDIKNFLKEREQDFLEFKIKVLLENAGDDTVLAAQAIEDVSNSLTLVKDPIKRSLLLKKCAQLLGLDEKILAKEQEKILRNKKFLQKVESTKTKNRITKEQRDAMDITSREREVVRIMLQYGEREMTFGLPVYKYLVEELADVTMSTAVYKKIWDICAGVVDGGKVFAIYHFTQSVEEDVRKVSLDLMAPSYDLSDKWDEFHGVDTETTGDVDEVETKAYKAVLMLKISTVQKMIEENLKAMSELEGDAKKVLIQEDFLDKHLLLKKTESELLHRLSEGP